MIQKNQFVKAKNYNTSREWFATDSDGGLEVSVSDDHGEPNEDYIKVANSVIDNLKDIQPAAEKFITKHLVFQDQYSLDGVEVLGAKDRGGASALLIFHREKDPYLRIEIGLADLKPVSVLAKYV